MISSSSSSGACGSKVFDLTLAAHGRFIGEITPHKSNKVLSSTHGRRVGAALLLREEGKTLHAIMVRRAIGANGDCLFPAEVPRLGLLDGEDMATENELLHEQ